MDISLRKVTETDDPFLYRLFVSSRPDLEALAENDPAMGELLLKQQFSLHKHMFVNYPTAEFSIVENEGRPVGRLYIRKKLDCHEILSIALLPEYRNMGIGSLLIRTVQHDADCVGGSVLLKVAWYNNGARSLYEKLGFELVEDANVYIAMAWRNVKKQHESV